MVILVTFSLTACGMGSNSGQTANNNGKSIQVEIENNASKSMVSMSIDTTSKYASAETATGSSKTENSNTTHTKEVYNCCGFIMDSGVTIKMSGTKGDRIVGLVNLLDYAKQDKTVNGYDFNIASSTEEVADKLINGEVDMAILPIEVAVKLYNDSKGKVRMVATTVIDTNKKWDKENKKKHSLAGIFTTSDFVKEKKNAVDGLIGDYSYSAMWVTNKDNKEDVYKLIKEYDIASPQKVEKAIASGKIACLRGETMKEAANTYLDSLKKIDKETIGELPNDDFYYIRDAK